MTLRSGGCIAIPSNPEAKHAPCVSRAPCRTPALRALAGEVKRRVALVGKGLTFDSGGYNLKVGGMIEMMKFDCGGAAAVLGAAEALAALKPPGVEARLATLSFCGGPFVRFDLSGSRAHARRR